MERIANKEMLHRDYNYGLLQFQITQPLYAECSDGRVVPALLGDAMRVADHEWAFKAGPKLPGESRYELGEIAEGIVHSISTTPASAWLGRLIKRVTVSRDRLQMHTRFPIAELPSVLTAQCLAFSLVGGRHVGDFKLAKGHEKKFATLLSVPDGRFGVELVDFGSRNEGRKKFFSGDINIGWGVGLPRDYYESDPGPFNEPINFNISYVLTAGSRVPAQLWSSIERYLEREPIVAPYLSTTVSRLFPVPKDRSQRNLPVEKGERTSSYGSAMTRSSVPLYFSGYHPNGDMAQEIAKQTEGLLYPVQVPYEDIVMNRVNPAGIILSLRVPLNSSPLGAIPETLGYLRQKGLTTAASAELSAMIKETLAMPAPSLEHLRCLVQAVNKVIRQITIGRLRVLFRSPISFETNSMGMFNFHELKGAINA